MGNEGTNQQQTGGALVRCHYNKNLYHITSSVINVFILRCIQAIGKRHSNEAEQHYNTFLQPAVFQQSWEKKKVLLLRKSEQFIISMQNNYTTC